ncbi:MAG: hypothetical protein ABSG42_01380, partial [Nitrospirota bacterium]
KPKNRIIMVSDSLREAGLPGRPDGPVYMPDGSTLAGGGCPLRDCAANMVSIGVPEDAANIFAGGNPERFLRGRDLT